jgi:hypothetical protein
LLVKNLDCKHYSKNCSLQNAWKFSVRLSEFEYKVKKTFQECRKQKIIFTTQNKHLISSQKTEVFKNTSSGQYHELENRINSEIMSLNEFFLAQEQVWSEKNERKLFQHCPKAGRKKTLAVKKTEIESWNNIREK